MLKKWSTCAGYRLSGENEGRAFTMRNVRDNGLCILTTREPYMDESRRYIFALFLVDESKEGSEDSAGEVRSHSDYKLTFNHDDARNFLFWDYNYNENSPIIPSWGTGLFRYLNYYQSAQILRRAFEIKKGSDEETLALKFFHYYCKRAGIKPDDLEEPSGALKR